MEKGDLFTHHFKVTSDVYNGFISVFNDKNPLHTDQNFAIEHGFKEAVMHGNILNGFLSYFIGECLPNKNVIIHSQEIKYSKPVYLNENLTLKITVDDIYESVDAVEFKYFFENQDNYKVAKGKIQIGILR